jgi:fatty acid desaturase
MDKQKIIKSGMLKFLLEVNSIYFTLKLAVLVLLLISGLFLINTELYILKVFGIIINGLMFAHAIELQHQAIHYTGFQSRIMNRAVGFLLGIPMLSSFSHYQYVHLKHHKLLGTKKNIEFFEYKTVENTFNFIIRLFSLNRYFKAIKSLFKSICRSKHDKGISDGINAKISNEYLAMFSIILSLLAISKTYHLTFLITSWIIPLILVAGPVHSLIELPEHYGCDKNNRNTFYNTRRIINPSRFAIWITNGNNFHLEHHAFPTIPVEKLKYLWEMYRNEAKYYNENYLEFYKEYFYKIMRGRK